MPAITTTMKVVYPGVILQRPLERGIGSLKQNKKAHSCYLCHSQVCQA